LDVSKFHAVQAEAAKIADAEDRRRLEAQFAEIVP
jgi:hypothetical protein